MSTEVPVASHDSSRPRTPASIVIALLLFAFAIASPFIGEVDARDALGFLSLPMLTFR